MKVLMVNTPASTRFRGGDLTQMRKTAEALRAFGVTVSESFEREPDARGFDLAHVFNLRTIQVTRDQVRHLKRLGVPIVMSPIYLNPSVARWAGRAITAIFRTARQDSELVRLLSDLGRRQIKVKRPGGEVLTADTQNRSWPDYDQRQREILQHVDHLLPNSLLEMNALLKTLTVHQIPFTVVPYAADPLFFLDPDPSPFVKKYGLRDFVLQAGRIEVSKNQLLLLYALRKCDVPVVLIGGNVQKYYLDWCRTYGPPGLKIIEHVSAEDLASAYAAARVHALPSWIETCGLVTMEAALGNCTVVASTAGYELEYYRDLAYYCDPADVNSIRATVLHALDNYGTDAPRRLRLKQLILHEYTWEEAAAATFQAYCRVLAKR